VNEVAKSLKLNLNATIRIHWFSSKSGGCQDFLLNLKCYNIKDLQVPHQIKSHGLQAFSFRFKMLQFIRSSGSHQTLKVANKFFFHVKCYNSKEPQVLIRPSRLPIFSFISNAAIHKIRRFLSNPPGCQDSPQFQIPQLKIWLVLIKISSLPRFSWNFNSSQDFQRCAGYHKNLKVAKIFFKDPEDLIKTSMLANFLLVSMLQFKDPQVLIKVSRFLVKC
jgi:hypothetical protein